MSEIPSNSNEELHNLAPTRGGKVIEAVFNNRASQESQASSAQIRRESINPEDTHTHTDPRSGAEPSNANWETTGGEQDEEWKLLLKGVDPEKISDKVIDLAKKMVAALATAQACSDEREKYQEAEKEYQEQVKSTKGNLMNQDWFVDKKLLGDHITYTQCSMMLDEIIKRAQSLRDELNYLIAPEDGLTKQQSVADGIEERNSVAEIDPTTPNQ